MIADPFGDAMASVLSPAMGPSPGQSSADRYMSDFWSAFAKRIDGNENRGGVKEARSLARGGNPFPLLALQWPSLVVTEEWESEFFDGEIGDELNPCLRIDPWQRTILLGAFDVTVGETAVKGCTGAGKGFTLAIVANLLFDVFNPCRINITSETFRHAQDNLFGEISVWRRRMANPAPANLLTARLQDDERHYITILNPSPHGAGEAFSGMHSEMTVYFFDEASAVPEIHYENALKNAKKIFFASNPRITQGMFRQLYTPMQGDGTKEERHERENKTGYCLGRKGRRLCVTVPSIDCANVRFGRLKEPVSPRRGIEINGRKYGPAERLTEKDFATVRALVPNQIDLAQHQEIIDTSKEKWQVDCYAHARFPSENPILQAILQSWLPSHIAAWKPGITVTAFGLDVARSLSGDDTCLSAGGIAGVAGIHNWQDNDNTRHVQKILRIAQQTYGVRLRDGDHPVVIDMAGGYGAGVADRLRQLGVWVIEFNPAGSPVVYPAIYRNQRTEWYLLLGRRLDPADNWTGYPWALPDDSDLHDELTSPMKIPQASGVSWGLESKKDIIGRLGRSPDKADSVVCLWRGVFERHQLIDKMNETVEGLIVSEAYSGERDPGESGEDDGDVDNLDRLINAIDGRNEEDEDSLPPPGLTTSDEVTLSDLLDCLGAATKNGSPSADRTERSFLERLFNDD